MQDTATFAKQLQFVQEYIYYFASDPPGSYPCPDYPNSNPTSSSTCNFPTAEDALSFCKQDQNCNGVSCQKPSAHSQIIIACYPAKAFSYLKTPVYSSVYKKTIVNLQRSDFAIAEKYGDYTCPESTQEGYCSFSAESAAKNYCMSDPTCVGYVYHNSGYALTQKPFINLSSNNSAIDVPVITGNLPNNAPASSMSSSLIIAISASCCVLLVAFGFLVWFFVKKNKQSRDKSTLGGSTAVYYPSLVLSSNSAEPMTHFEIQEFYSKQ